MGKIKRSFVLWLSRHRAARVHRPLSRAFVKKYENLRSLIIPTGTVHAGGTRTRYTAAYLIKRQLLHKRTAQRRGMHFLFLHIKRAEAAECIIERSQEANSRPWNITVKRRFVSRDKYITAIHKRIQIDTATTREHESFESFT